MTISHVRFAWAFSALLVGCPQAWAAPVSALEVVQQESRFSSPSRIAVIDMATVFRATSEFHEQRDRLKKEVEDAQILTKEMSREIQTMSLQLKKLDKDTKDYADQEFRIKRKTLDFENYGRELQLEFRRKEATIYRDIYLMVSREVAEYAKEHSIDLVIRSVPLEKSLEDTDPGEMLETLNRIIVFQKDRCDITQDIIGRIKQHPVKNSSASEPSN